MSDNKLPALPTYVGGFAQLKSLNVNNNRLSNIEYDLLTFLLDTVL